MKRPITVMFMGLIMIWGGGGRGSAVKNFRPKLFFPEKQIRAYEKICFSG